MTRRSFSWLAEACSQLLIFLSCMANPLQQSLKPGGQNVCSSTTQHTITQSQTLPRAYVAKYYTSCGFGGWNRCSRYRQSFITRYYMIYITTHHFHYFCCHGWTQHGEECTEPVRCPKPPTLGNGTPIGHVHHYRGVVQYSCNAGYCLNGNASITCTGDGNWTTNLASCTRTLCPLPVALSNGSYSIDSRELKGVVAYRCNMGFSLVGTAKRTCEKRHPNVCEVKWSDRLPQCQAVDCGNPKTSVNGGFRGSTTFNMAIHFFCNNGYFVQGSQSAMCRGDQSWSTIPPRCIPYCIKPSDPTNGKVILPRHTNPRRILTKTDITYKCNYGYIWVGATNVISCSGSLTWSHNLPTCQRGDCGTILDPANGDCTETHTYIRGVRTCRCVRGFKLDKPSLSTSVCVIKNNVAKWNKARPNCYRIICPNLRGTANPGVILKVTGNYLDDTARYVCSPRYKQKTGDMTRICTRDGTWTESPLECEIKTCRELQSLKFGYLSEHNLTFGSRVSYSCEEGYELKYGLKQRTCMFNGQWSGTAPICQYVRCNPPPDLVYGGVLEDRFSYGETVKYRCSLGYRISGSEFALCQANGNWNITSPPTCQLISCSKPSTIDNGFFVGHVFHYNGVVRFRCNPGYCLNGNASMTCAANGEWSGTKPTCISTLCNTPLEIANGSYEANSRRIGATVTYRCNLGFSLIGSAVGTCEHAQSDSCQSTWSINPPKCQAKDCGLLPLLTNGRTDVLMGDGRRYPSYVHHTCDVGHHLVGGSEFRRCHYTGHWNGKQPNCKPVYCGAVHKPSNGLLMVTKLSYEGVALFSCDKGYRLVGKEKLVCQHSGEWTDAVPICTSTSCLPVKDLANGMISVSGSVIGSFIKFVCFTGYELHGRSSLTCTQPRNGFARWNGRQPSCRAVLCKRPQSPANGFVSGGDYHYPNHIVYGCKEGFVLSGDGLYNRRFCNSSGMWTGTAPSCQPITCSRPSVPRNGRLIGGDVFVNNTVTFSCVGGYRLVGPIHSTCQTDGYWSHKFPTCLAVRCSPPSLPIHGRVLPTEGRYNDRAVYLCHRGYRLSGLSVRVCKQRNDLGMWTGTTPRCDPIWCPPLRPPINGRLRGYLFYYQKSVKYECSFGFAAVLGNIERNCTESGHWSGSAPTCEDICGRKDAGCSENQMCVVDKEGRPRCICRSPLDCAKDYDPVCGTDGKSYMNECYLKAAACNLGVGNLSKAEKGECRFSCSLCHKSADCLDNAICRCKPQYVGDGRYCCSENLGNQVAIAGAAPLFQCNKGCMIPYTRVTWYFNGDLLDTSRDRYFVAKDGMHLYFANVSAADTGEYTCQISFGSSTYERYGSLELADGNKRLHSSVDCSSNCGKSCARKRFIAGGEGSHPGQFPWQAMLCTPRKGQYCGGVLVSSQCIVTAAHCVVQEGSPVSNINACLGRHCGNCSETDPEGNPQCFQPRSVVVHSQFDRRTLDNDIAVLRLSRAPSCDCTSVIPVCLPNETRDGALFGAQKEGIVTGWGRVNSTISRSKCLRKGSVRLASRRICSNRHDKYPITDSMMCATDYNGACEGDSGGPLVVRNRHFGGRYVLAGIVSWGEGCGNARKLGVYTKVLHHLDWIKKTCGM